MRDAGHELADGREALLPNHLALQRLELFAHAPLLAHLPVNLVARRIEARSIEIERVLQLGEFRVGIGLRVTGVKSPDAIRCARRLEVRQRRRQTPRQSERHQQPPGKPDRENREAADPQRGRAVERQRHRHAHAHQPRAVVHARFAVHAAHAVEAGVLDRIARVARLAHLGRQKLPHVFPRLAAACQDPAVGIGNRDDGTLGDRKEGQRILHVLEVDVEANRPNFILRRVADGIPEHDVVEAR